MGLPQQPHYVRLASFAANAKLGNRKLKFMAIDELNLEEGEKIEWHKGQGTFHRGYDFELAITNMAVCIFMRRHSLSPKWIKIPLDDVVSLDVSEAKVFQGFLSLLPLYGMLIIVLIGNYSIFWSSYSNTKTVIWSILLIGFIVYLIVSIDNMSRGRTHLTISSVHDVLNYTSYPDSYQDEKILDRCILLEFAQLLKEKGIIKQINIKLPNKDNSADAKSCSAD